MRHQSINHRWGGDGQQPGRKRMGTKGVSPYCWTDVPLPNRKHHLQLVFEHNSSSYNHFTALSIITSSVRSQKKHNATYEPWNSSSIVHIKGTKEHCEAALIHLTECQNWHCEAQVPTHLLRSWFCDLSLPECQIKQPTTWNTSGHPCPKRRTVHNVAPKDCPR